LLHALPIRFGFHPDENQAWIRAVWQAGVNPDLWSNWYGTSDRAEFVA
jgi:hypothetical protein